MNDLSQMSTEQINERTGGFSILPIREALEIMNEEDQKVALAVRKEIPR